MHFRKAQEGIIRFQKTLKNKIFYFRGIAQILCLYHVWVCHMYENRCIELLAKRKSGEISLKEQREFVQLLEDHPDLSSIIQKLNEVYDASVFSDGLNEDEDAYVARHWGIFEKNIREEDRYPDSKLAKLASLHWVKLVAASVAVVLGISLYIFQTHKSSSQSPNVVVAPPASRSNLVLPDGTRVWLNANTKLSYEKSFGESERRVTIEGEAFFDVKKDKNHPFIVHTKTFNVKVLGTAFNIRAYQSDMTAQATVVRGSVEVELTQREHEKIVLKPNQKIEVKTQSTVADNGMSQNADEKTPQLVLAAAERMPEEASVSEALWMYNKLVFHYERIDQIAAEIERWYNVSVTIETPALKSKKLSGVFEDKSVEEVLDALKLAGKFEYKKKGRTITIK